MEDYGGDLSQMIQLRGHRGADTETYGGDFIFALDADSANSWQKIKHVLVDGRCRSDWITGEESTTRLYRCPGYGLIAVDEHSGGCHPLPPLCRTVLPLLFEKKSFGLQKGKHVGSGFFDQHI